MQSMPHLVRWAEEFGDFGLTVIAPHVQDAPEAEVKAAAARLGIRFPVTASGRVPGAAIEGIPHLLVFDHDGKCVYEGHPAKAEEAVRKAVGGSLVAAANRESFPKPLTTVVDGLKKGQPPKALLTKLLPLRTASDKETAEAAKALADGILGFAEKRLEEATAAGPVDGYDTATRLAASMKGTPVGTKASQTAVKLRTDKAVADELKVRPTLEKLKALAGSIEQAAQARKVEPGSEPFKKAFAVQLKQAAGLHQQMQKSAPDARATQEAAGIIEKLGTK